ncbi:MAG TPA: hypothetical protein VMT30_00055 [Candidatus Saccharimonadia bacterium]|nr:hypothetical protein [Candidatus Saccharimonadia bacterium]
MNKELQRAQDMLAAMQAQRDNALNAVVMMQADLADARRVVDAANNEMTELRAHLAASQAAYIEIIKPFEPDHRGTTLPAGNEQTLNGGVVSSQVDDIQIGVPTI